MSTAYCGMKLIPGDGRDTVQEAVVLVEDGVIKEVGAAGQVCIPPEAQRVDLSGRVMLPGMIDTHIHCLMDASPDPMSSLTQRAEGVTVLQAAEHLKATARSGITWVRDLGGYNYLEMSLQEAAGEAMIPGSRMLVAGRVITMTGGHGYPMGREADGEAEVRRAAREQLKAGADVVKVMATGGVLTSGVEPGAAQLTEKEMRAAVTEAHKAGRRVAAHAQGTEGIKNALRAGVDSVEHGLFLDEEAVRMMKQAGTWLVPTLTATRRIVDAGTEAGIPQFAVRKAKDALQSHLKSFRMAVDGGVKVAMGTDAGTPFNRHGDNLQELRLMVEAGMSPSDAIYAACGGAAELLGIEDRAGTLKKGRRADMVVLEADPLADIENIHRQERVYMDGRRLL